MRESLEFGVVGCTRSIILSHIPRQATSAVYPGGGDGGDGGGDGESNPIANDDGPTASCAVLCRVAIYAEKPNLRNFWAGSWLSLWTVARDSEGAGGLTISGSVRIRAHCFEEGNMRMETAKTCPPAALNKVGGPAGVS